MTTSLTLPESSSSCTISHEVSFLNSLTKRDKENTELEKKCKGLVKIPEPSVFGTFSNNRHYLQTVEFLTNFTNETTNRVNFFLKNILPKLPIKERLLDVGPGNGILSTYLGPHFFHITLVDADQNVLEEVKHRLFIKKHVSIECIHDAIENVPLHDNDFDLAVLSHVLYHVSRLEWNNLVHKVYSSLRNGGYLVIVINDGLDRSKLTQHFGGINLNIEKLITDCQKSLDTEVSIFITNEVVTTHEQEYIMHIAGLFLHDAQTATSKVDLADFIDKEFLKVDGRDEMTMQQTLIVLKKSCDKRRKCLKFSL